MSTMNSRSTRPRGTSWAPALFTVPALALYLPFVILPFLGAAGMSAFDWEESSSPVFVGAQNYTSVVSSPEFRQSFLNTAIYLAATLVLEVMVGLLLALVLQSKILGARLYQGLFFAPVILSMTLVGLLWKSVLNAHVGLLNAALQRIGLEGFNHPWLGDSSTALLSVCVVSGWKFAGFYMVIFLAALKAIPEEIYEASKLDGAGSIRRSLHITVPLVSETWWLCALICATGAFQTFDLVYVLTGGGPHHCTDVVISWMVQIAFDRLHFGEGAAISVLVTLVVLAFALPYRWLSRRAGEAR